MYEASALRHGMRSGVRWMAAGDDVLQLKCPVGPVAKGRNCGGSDPLATSRWQQPVANQCASVRRVEARQTNLTNNRGYAGLVRDFDHKIDCLLLSEPALLPLNPSFCRCLRRIGWHDVPPSDVAVGPCVD